MSDLDRWVNLEGPPPPGIRELLDAAVPRLPAEREASLDRRILEAAAEERRRWQRRRTMKRVAAVTAAVALAAGVALILRSAPRDDSVADRPMPIDSGSRARELPMLSDTAPGTGPDAGSPKRGPGSRRPPAPR